MADVRMAPYLYDDELIFVSASGVAVVTRGDWVIASAQWGIAADDATIGSPAYKVSAFGVAAANHPGYDDQGVAVNKPLPVLTRGVFRVSGAVSGSAFTVPVGSFAYPDASASGIVGTTGATGVGPLWNTAAPALGSANPTGAPPLGVAQVIQQHGGGDATAVQMDIRVNLATNVGLY